MEYIDEYRCKYNYDRNELEIVVDGEIIEINDLISKCITEDIAEEILKYLLEDIDSIDLEEILKIFYKISNMSYYTSKNDINLTEDIDDIYDYRIYRLLECSDTCHNFFNSDYIDQEQQSINIHEYIVENRYILPNGLTANAFVKDNYIKIFIPYIVKQRTFIFGDDHVDNPLFGSTILKKLYVSEDIETLDDTKHQQISVDIYMTINDKITKILYLKQIVQVISTIRSTFGDTCVFNIDSSNDYVTMLMRGIQNLSKACSKEFDTEIKNIPHTSWTTCITDANFYDSSEHYMISDLKVDEHSTGNIFRKESTYQITLHGIIKEKDVHYLDIRIIDKVKNIIWDKPLLAHETLKYFSKNTLHDYITIISSKTELKTLQDYILAFSKPLKYGLQRAGDWGQVEHCKRHNKVFVTSNKLAAVYAVYRDIRFIFIRGTSWGTSCPPPPPPA